MGATRHGGRQEGDTGGSAAPGAATVSLRPTPDVATRELVRCALEVAEARERQLDAIERALEEGDDARALELMRVFLGGGRGRTVAEGSPIAKQRGRQEGDR